MLPSPCSSDSSRNVEEYSTDAVSPGIMSSDLGLDPSDPLNLLLHNTAQGADSCMESSKEGNVPNWSQLTSPWSMHNLDEWKYPDMGMDFNLSLPMSMDYNPSMAVEPSALHFDSSYHQPPLFTSNVLPTSFPFTFGSDESSSPSSHGDSRQRRLSITSSSSSSGASLSPVIEAETPSVAIIENPADELAQRVRQSAGVMLAVPSGMHLHPQSFQR